MRRVLPLLIAAAALGGGAAHAESCYGTNEFRACADLNRSGLPTVNPTGSSFSDCIYVGSGCIPVSVPVPTVTPGSGPIVTWNCYFPGDNCVAFINRLLSPY